MLSRNGKSAAFLATILALVCWFMLSGYMGKKPTPAKHYLNQEFGFEIVHPGSWVIASQADAKRREEQARARSSDPENTTFIDSEVVSFAVPIGNQKVGQLSVRSCRLDPSVYLERSLTYMRSNQDDLSVAVVEQPDTCRVAKRMFWRVKLELQSGPSVVLQEIYVTASKEGALMFGLTARTEENMADIRRAFRTLQFR